jgi:hypothetical protein
MQGDVARATALLEEALAGVQASGMTWDIPMTLALLGHLVCQQQNYPLAKARYREALVLYRAFGSPTYIASCLEGYAAAACAEGHYAQATRLCAQASTLREQTQATLLPVEREAFKQVVATARAALDESAFVREWNTGKTRRTKRLTMVVGLKSTSPGYSDRLLDGRPRAFTKMLYPFVKKLPKGL